MPEPVLVVHGVGNRDKRLFGQTVRKLNRTLGPQWNLIPVFWGDLGAKTERELFDTLPMRPGAEEIRGFDPALMGEFLQMDESVEEVRTVGKQEELIFRGIASTREITVNEVVRQVVREELPRTHYLKYVQNPAVLKAVGRALDEAVGNVERETEGVGGDTLRGGGGGNEYDTRGVLDTVSNVSRTMIHQLDNLVGVAVGEAVGRANQKLRQAIGQDFVSFVGDILVYQHHQQAIHSRFWQVIDARAKGYGTEQQPINVLAHSLGGVAVFDAAIRRERPLWVQGLVTFGSQPAFFHVIDPRRELSQYIHGTPVALPQTIGRWTNLWEPMDFLAFTAGTVFRLSSKRQPEDRVVNSTVSSLAQNKGFTHSTYWHAKELLEAVRDTFNP